CPQPPAGSRSLCCTLPFLPASSASSACPLLPVGLPNSPPPFFSPHIPGAWPTESEKPGSPRLDPRPNSLDQVAIHQQPHSHPRFRRDARGIRHDRATQRVVRRDFAHLGGRARGG